MYVCMCVCVCVCVCVYVCMCVCTLHTVVFVVVCRQSYVLKNIIGY